MGTVFRILLFYFTLLIVVVKCDDIIVEINDDVTVDVNGNLVTLSMKENNHDFDADEIPLYPLFKIIGATSEPTISFVQSSTFQHHIGAVEGEATNYIFYANQSFDFETQDSLYRFNIYINSNAPLVTLNIVNIDDEPPSLTPPQCTFDENTIFTAENSTCSSIVSDPDGWLSQMTFEIVNKTNDEPYIFALEYRETPDNLTYSASVYMTVRHELNYQNITFYLFDIKAQDGAGHSTTPNELVRAIVNVNDLPDTPPEWTNFFTSQQFYEQSEQEFTVTAIDGDYGLNYEINYQKLWEDDEEANYISIDNNGTITVGKIDRDKDDISTYQFEIMAYEVPDAPIWNNTLLITFFVMDIDNNPPLIRWIIDSSFTNITFNNTDDEVKSTELSFLENFSGTLDLTIFIRDIDTGENAQFTVELEDLADNAIKYTEAFIIVPTAGYRSGQFQISVRNATYLDYEVAEWVHITFNVLTRGVLDEEKEDRMLVDITLIDYNDEYPIFAESEYSIEINETAKIDTFIIEIMATDRDAEDKILTHVLLGSTYTNSVLRIESDTGRIYVASENAFDYDTVNPIFVQVRAIDHANHTATVPLTINLLDVNNKAPTISVGDPINVDENQNSTTKLNATITASDMDTTADLAAEIDWDASYAMKNSRRLDMTNETINQQVRFLNVEYSRVSDEDTNRDIKIDLVVNDNNPDATTPDFELFDSLYLSLKVIDWNTDPEFLDRQNTSTLILISINDINDNTPYFPEANLPESERENRTVQEYAPAGTSASSIVAIDLDVDDTVTYECTALDPNFDWIDVNYQSGAFTVKDSNLIDADTHKTFYFNYSCTASDDGYTHTSEPLIVRFYIIDTNNQVPTITIDDIVYVDEKSEALTTVSEVGTDDLDRDIPFHTVACNLDREETCAEKFIIVDNVIKVRNGHDDIDRDVGPSNYTCPMTCQDNPDRLQNDRNPNTVTRTFIIRLNDINDHTPEVLTESLTTTENAVKGEIIGIILATDADEGDNAEIDFSVENVATSNGEEVTDLFETVTDDDYFVDLTHKQANLVALKDLRDSFGTYNVTIRVADRGDQPNVATYYITVQVEKFNFEPPRFVVPSAAGTNVLLLSSQTPFTPLILFRSQDSEYLDDFYASDNSESDICRKWDVDIDFEQLSPDEETIFVISKTDVCTGQLQVNNNFDPESVLGKTYNLKLVATAREGDPQEGEASYTTETTITINFLDNNQKPVFNCSKMEFEFVEEKDDQTQKLACFASYEVEDDDLPVFYYLDPKTATDVVNDTFDVDSYTGLISLKKTISYKENEEFQFQIVASNDSSPTSNNPNSYLSVTCTVLEINNNHPQWRRDRFFGAIMAGYIRNTPILTLEATDADKIDQGKLTYFINGTITNSGSGLNNLPSEPFILSQSTGEIRLNFQVDSTMSGYFQFDVTVWDVEDQFGNGPHWNTTSVTIFIITSDNTVDFRFLNTIEEVQDQEEGMLAVISEVLSYDAYKQNIDHETENGIELEDRTFASLYFINSSSSSSSGNIEAITSNTILRLVSNINTFSELVVELRNRTGLTLMSFPSSNSSSENLEEVLKAWLVGVSVVLGALCLILLVTFVLKTRELNNRIKKLTTNKFGSQDSGLNRLGISAPTTNKHAIEGSNPIFNINSDDAKRDLKNYDDFDGHSLRSGDSDLIGIEDNPEFDYHHNQNSNHM